MSKFNGWIVRNKWKSFLLWTAGETREEVRRKVPDWKEWEKEGHRIIKFKCIEIKEA